MGKVFCFQRASGIIFVKHGPNTYLQYGPDGWTSLSIVIAKSASFPKSPASDIHNLSRCMSGRMQSLHFQRKRAHANHKVHATILGT
mmetsp:Transcript_56442/g.98663  ORF Transcript_56442/g.98663 Transcript_56442/m.98663 type:complete len:87 (-) Transcript_56442:1329-1589(-)